MTLAEVNMPTDSWDDFGPPERRFHLINVSLGKSGTTSIAGIFRHYRAAHEFMFPEAAEAIHAYTHGRLDAAGLRRFALLRAVAGGLEVDSASFNHWYADHLAAAFPRARFVLCIREPRAWLESALGQMWREHHAAQGEGRPIRPWLQQIGDVIVGPFDWSVFEELPSLRQALPGLAAPLLRYWGRAHQTLLDRLPWTRWLVLETPALSNAATRLADLAGVAVDTLDRSATHLHRRGSEPRLLPESDPAWLVDAIDRECGRTWLALRAKL